MNDKETVKEGTLRKKVIAGILMGIAAVIIALVCIFIGIPLIKMAGEPMKFREWVDAKGVWGPVIYVALVIFQILIAFIPGEPLEIVAGYVFGTFKGTLLCLAAASIGSIIVLLLVRRFGKVILEIYFDKEKIDKKCRKEAEKMIKSMCGHKHYPVQSLVHTIVLNVGIKPLVKKKGDLYQGVQDNWKELGIYM